MELDELFIQILLPGVFAARRGIFSLEDYVSILKLNADNPGKFKFGDMGFHNLMVFRGAANGRLRVRSENFQVIFTEHEQSCLQKRFAFDSDGLPLVVPGDEQVLHMPDKKPLIEATDCYSKPMTYFRLKYLKDTEDLEGDDAMHRLLKEDKEYQTLRGAFLRKEKLKKLRRLLLCHPGQWNQLFKRVFAR